MSLNMLPRSHDCFLQLSNACRALSQLIKSINDAPPDILSLSNEFTNLKLLLVGLGLSKTSSREKRPLDEAIAILLSDEATWCDHMALIKHLEWSYCIIGFEARRRRWIRDRRSVISAVDYAQVKIMTIKNEISRSAYVITSAAFYSDTNNFSGISFDKQSLD
jgi:hypothetical protein